MSSGDGLNQIKGDGRNGVLELVDNLKRGRGRPKLTWVESVKRDLKDWNISKEIALDRSAWRLAINVPEP